MATQNLSAQAAKSNTIPDWQKAQIKEAHSTFSRILDPLMLFSELLAAYGAA